MKMAGGAKPFGIDEEQVFAIVGVGQTGAADVDIQPAILVNVDHGNTRTPSFLRSNSGILGNVVKFKTAFVQEESIVYHVAGKEDIR